jgi:hypothetical protein
MDKKGALELSINAIVIIVLAMTLLGLGLTFIRNQMNKAGEMSTGVSDAVKDKIMEDLRTGDKALSFPTPQITIGRNENQIISIGIRNLNDNELKFRVLIQDLSVDDNSDYLDCGDSNQYKPTPSSEATAECAAFFWDYSVQTLQAGGDLVTGIKLFPPKTFGSYLYKLKIVIDGTADEYASKTFFVQVV